MASICPFCHISFPLSELEWHANNHFMEDDLIRDMELAQQISLATESPTSTVSSGKVANTLLQCGDWTSEYSFSTSCDNGNNCLESHQEMNCSLVKFQTRDNFYKVEGDILSLLMRCLEKESRNTSIITINIDHYQSASEDSGWGCGWRNIQMLSSHIMAQRKEVREVIFGGSGFIPDIPSLQKWLELAWARGFDIPGSKSFKNTIYSSRKWIGTTECAALLRSFGLRARVVDFDGKSSSSLSTLTKNSEKRKVNDKVKSKKIHGPMDKFLIGKEQEYASPVNESTAGVHCNSSFSSVGNVSQETGCSKRGGPQILLHWVWNYFMDGVHCKSASPQNVLTTQKTPLYFQHDGHSRTIIGIQRLKGVSEEPDQYTLLVLDPGQRTAALERALMENSGWQRLVKRGVHTLRKPQYQLCYIDPGIASGEELNQLKKIDSLRIEI